MKTKAEEIARIAHTVNKAYCEALGDQSQPDWDEAPDWQKESAVAGVKFHQDNPEAGPQASHEAWLAQKEADGWTFGEEKDAEAKTHPCMVPFADLPVEQQAKDHIFRSIVHACSDIDMKGQSKKVGKISETINLCLEKAKGNALCLALKEAIREAKRVGE